jgi:hypothetical protein
MAKQKTFMWVLEGAYGEEPSYGPFYFEYAKKIGTKMSHKLEDLLKLDIEASLKRKLRQARPGQMIAFSPVSSTSELFLKCLSDKQIKQLKQLQGIDKKSKIFKKQALSAQLKYEAVTNKLLRHSRFKKSITC